ncbi:hypothetical protein VTJ04DRAFT_4810 [Mycothermus thermophilus]|uniref:uncharacterized protein n=1 Tax=Humicola insolens TaxID=85995 RepID=UPI003743272F
MDPTASASPPTTTTDGDEPRTLKAVWAEAESKRLALENTSFPPNSPDYSDAVSAVVRLYNEAIGLISTLSLFSPNESAEDLTTSNLPFLLANFHLAEATQRLPGPTPPERKRILASARDAYERFLHQLDSYGLLSPEHKKLLERYDDEPEKFSTVPASADPAARRAAKIANLQAEKQLKARLEFLRSRPGYGDPDAEGSGTAGAGIGDEDAVRETHLAHLNYSVHMTFQALEGLNRELEVLAMAPPPPPPGAAGAAMGPAPPPDLRDRRRPDGRAPDNTARLDTPLTQGSSGLINRGGPLLSRDGKPLQPFTLVNSRQEIAKGVFRPGHNLPTMTIDEYLEEERRRGGIIEGGGEASWKQPEPDEDNMEKADEETMKARAWDEFVEANPKGSGNTLNRG